MPREAVRLYQLVVAGELDAAMQLWSRMIPSLLFIWRGHYIPKVKAASRLRGFNGGAVRKPLCELDTATEGLLAQSLEPLDQE
jgi:4-hydroxy-tetrahydrodipicolinate synthase